MNNEKKLKILILASGIGIVFLTMVFASAQYTKTPSFCNLCHAIQPQYEAWKKSSHSNVACIKCHYTPGIFKIFGDEKWAQKTVQFTTQLWERPVETLYPVDNEVCFKCHSENREATPSGDLIIPHDLHEAKNVRCIACHRGLVHGEEKIIKVVQAREFEDPQNPNHPQFPKKTCMNDCLECHVEENQTLACEACHTDIVKPENHKAPNFMTEHGLQAMADVDSCNKCHAYTFNNEGVENEEDRVRKYARGNVFCYNCHQKRPQRHDGEWDIKHPVLAKANLAGCLICHEEDKPQKGEKVTKTYCNQCHYDPHQSGWRNIHPAKVKSEGTAKNKCFDCHGQSQCFACHTGKR